MVAAPVDRADLAHRVLGALDQRLSKAALHLLDEVVDVAEDAPPGVFASQVLPRLVERVHGGGHDATWLLLVALQGAFPTTGEVVAFERYLDLEPRRFAQSTILERALAHPHRGRLDLPMEVVVDGVVVDVNFTARHDTHTGIHRVVRETIPRWRRDHAVTAAAWLDDSSAFRTLTSVEDDRVFRFGQSDGADVTPSATHEERLVVPWRSVVVLPDVPAGPTSDRLVNLATRSGNVLALVGYDMIPITSAEQRPAQDSVVFAHYLSVVKHAHRVAAISRSATDEFAGFAAAVQAQGIAGPTVREVLLTEDAPPAAGQIASAEHARPKIVVVGSREPHKNQRTVVHAAERLWREGLEFDLELIGGAGWKDVVAPAIRRVTDLGFPLVDRGRVSDEDMWAALRSASFTVFISLHEGYGLPLADSLACGVPAVTSRFGSQQEIAEAGGCLLVDPRDDDDVTGAMRRLLTDPELLESLRREAAARPTRSWDDYARELWDTLVVPEGEDA